MIGMRTRLVLAGVGDLLELDNLQSLRLFFRHGTGNANLLAIMPEEGVMVAF